MWERLEKAVPSYILIGSRLGNHPSTLHSTFATEGCKLELFKKQGFEKARSVLVCVCSGWMCRVTK